MNHWNAASFLLTSCWSQWPPPPIQLISQLRRTKWVCYNIVINVLFAISHDLINAIDYRIQSANIRRSLVRSKFSVLTLGAGEKKVYPSDKIIIINYTKSFHVNNAAEREREEQKSMASSEPNSRTMRSENVMSDVRAHIDRKQNERGWPVCGVGEVVGRTRHECENDDYFTWKCFTNRPICLQMNDIYRLRELAPSHALNVDVSAAFVGHQRRHSNGSNRSGDGFSRLYAVAVATAPNNMKMDAWHEYAFIRPHTMADKSTRMEKFSMAWIRFREPAWKSTNVHFVHIIRVLYIIRS